MNLWLRLWDGVSNEDREAGERAQELLARVEGLEPQSTMYYTGTGRRVNGRKEVSYIEWCQTGPEGVGISMQFAQGTPDGELFTEVQWESGYESRCASVRVSLQQAGTRHHLEGYGFLKEGDHFNDGCVNPHAFAHIHEWLERRAHTVRSAIEAAAAHRAAIELQERESQKRDSYAEAMRRKYLK